MSNSMFNGFTRRAASAVSRRHSLQIGAAAVAACAWQPMRNAVAGNGGNNAGKKCRRQRGQCAEVVRERCQPVEFKAGAEAIAAPDDCVKRLLPCCEHFAKCQAGAALDCLMKPLR